MSKNCLEIVKPFVEKMAQHEVYCGMQMIGGVGSAALVHPELQIDVEAQTLEVPEDLHLDQFREDGNKRDMDVLMLSAEKHDIEITEAVARDIIGDDLEISIFGLKPLSKLKQQAEQPILSSVKTFLSDRYGDKKALFPFAVPLGTLDTWRLHVGDTTIPVPHPGMSIANYLTRSISGLRAKDAAKVNEISENVLTKSPEIHEWLIEGEGQDLLKLARILHSLRESSKNPKPLIVGKQLELLPDSYRDLKDHDAFMLPDSPEFAQQALIRAARLKSRTLRIAESNPTIVTMWQRFAEKRAGTFVKNN